MEELIEVIQGLKQPGCIDYIQLGSAIVSVIDVYKRQGVSRVGWYTEPVVLMYAADGRTRYTLKSEVDAYKKVGWYTCLLYTSRCV